MLKAMKCIICNDCLASESLKILSPKKHLVYTASQAYW